MKRIFKKGISVFLVVAMLLCAAPLNGFIGLDLPSLFDIGAKAATTGLTTYEGSELTYTFETDIKPSEDGNIYLLPGETVKISVYMTTNYYTGSSGSEFFLWTSGIFNDLGENYSVLNFAAESLSRATNPAPNSVYPSTHSKDSYTGLLVARNNDVVSRVLDNELIYEFNLTVADDAAIGSVATFEMPAASIRSSTSAGTIYSDVRDKGGNWLAYYAETVNVPESLNFVVSDVVDDCVFASGICGEDVAWDLYRSGKLVISGTGDMEDFSNSNYGYGPWGDYFWEGYNISDVIIEDGVTSVSNFAFSGLCDYSEDDELIGLKNVIIADSVLSIGRDAFSFSSALETVLIGDGVTSIGQNAFMFCNYLTNVTIGENVIDIGEGAFEGTALTSINIPNSVKTIGDYAFSYCPSLTNVEIPDSVIIIGDEAFSFCDYLTNVTIGENVTDIGYGAFVGCTALKKVYFAGTKVQWNAIGYSDWDDPVPTIYFNHPDHTCEWVTKTEPDCINEGISVYKCTICEDEVDTRPIEPNGHTAGEWETKTEPDCVNEGVSVKKCIVCKAELETQPIEPNGHTAGEWETKIEPDCVNEGVSVKKCTVCKAELETQPIEPNGHTAGEWETKTEPDCVNEGVSVKKCIVCKAELETQPIEPNGHTAGEWETKTEPDCVNEGVSVKKCTVCKAEVETQPIAPNGHTAGEWETKSEPDCVNDGVSVKKCTVCKVELETKPIDALGHTAGEWKLTTQPTTSEEGVLTLFCSVCGAGYETSSVPVLDSNCEYLIWEVTDDDYAKITGYNPGLSGDITLPATICGYPVIIGKGAFVGSNITSVTVPDGITKIGNAAFGMCTSLVSVNLPASLEELYYTAFVGSTNIESIVINENNPYYCTDEESIIFSKDKTKLIYVPAKSIGNAYVMPETVTTAEEFAFIDCEDFSLTLSDDFYVDSWYSYFFGVLSVNEFIVSENCVNYSVIDGVLYSEDGLTIVKYPVDSKRELFVLPDKVQDIDSELVFFTLELEHDLLDFFDLPCDPDTFSFYKFPEYLTVHINSYNRFESYDLWQLAIGLSHFCFEDITVEQKTEFNELVHRMSASIEQDWLEEKEELTPGTSKYYYYKSMYLDIAQKLPTLIDCENDHSFLHIYAEVLDYKAATCTEDGYGDYSCECGYTFHKDYLAPGHAYEEKITVKAGCTTAGKKTFTCHCGDTYSQVVPATGHSLGKFHVDPTCITDGKDCYLCSNCLTEFSVKFLPATGHTEGDWEIKSEPTCTKAGVKVKKCITCDEVIETESYGEAKGHNYEETVISEATCTANGKKKYTCHCGYGYTVTTPMLEHDTVRYYTPPTCFVPGMEYYLCNSCGNMIGDMEIIPETGHIYGWAVVAAPTATESGSKKQVCTGCGEETGVVETIPATGFEPINGMVVDYANNIVYGLDAGVNSLDIYTNIVADSCEWSYTPGQFGGFGTGTKATLKNGDEIIGEYTIVIFGDVNGDSWYDGEDAFLVNLIAKGMLDKDDVGEAIWTAADCNHDGVIDELDVDLLTGAGLLLNDVDQSKTATELAANSDYIEYVMLIDQSAGMTPGIAPDVDNSQQWTTDTNTTLEQSADEINIEEIFTFIFDLIKKLFNLIFSFVIK